MRALSLLLIGVCVCAAAPVGAQQPGGAGAPETFSANAQAGNRAGSAVSASIQIHIERYTPDFDRNAVQEALRIGGYPGFLPALRKAPDVGYVELGGQKTTIRWARQTFLRMRNKPPLKGKRQKSGAMTLVRAGAERNIKNAAALSFFTVTVGIIADAVVSGV